MADVSVPSDVYLPDTIPAADREVMVSEYGAGSEVGFGERAAILVVDMTRQFVEDEYPAGHAATGRPAAAAISRLLDRASELGIRGYFGRPTSWGLAVERGRWADVTGADDTEDRQATDPPRTQLVAELEPGSQDVVIDRKYKPSLFFGTQLESMLTYDRVDTLVVTGMTTSGCVRATVVDAFSYNYRVVVPEECVADRSQISHEVALFDIDQKYGDVRPLEWVLEGLPESS